MNHRTALLMAILAVVPGACAPEPPAATPGIQAGSPDRPREVNIIARDYSFDPDVVEFVPGETVVLHVINGGLAVHEAVIGDQAVQDAWALAESATEGAPPGPTPLVSVPPGVEGLRIVVASGELVDVVWNVPDTRAPFIVGCHIPGHWEKGMQVPVRWIEPDDGTSSTP